MRWIRLEVAFDESWLFPLSPAAQLAWIKLLCTCKRDGVRGEMKALSPIVAARKWAVSVDDVESLYAAAKADGALVIEGDQMSVVNWLKYNPLDRTAAERQRRSRSPQSVTAANMGSPTVTVGHDGSRRDSVTKRDHLSRDTVPNRVPNRTTKTTTMADSDESGMPEFESVFAGYPRRAGSNPKGPALREFSARRKEGTPLEVLAEGTARYKAFCEATDKIGTEIVMQAKRFYGREKSFLEPFDIPTAGKTAQPNPKAQATWQIMVASGVHLASTAESRLEIIGQLVAQGQVKDGEKFLTFLRSLDKPTLTRLSAQGDDKGCIRHIAEKLEAAA